MLLIVHIVGNGKIRDRFGRGSLRSIYGFRTCFNYKTVIFNGDVGDILIYIVLQIIVDSVCIRICTAIDRLNRIGIMLGNDNTVKAVNLLNRLIVKQKCRGRLKCIEENAIGRIPLSIIKILIELDCALALLPLLLLLSSLDPEVKSDRAEKQGKESCNEGYEYVKHRIVPAVRLNLRVLCKSRYSRSE